jgi:hypothetical protein
MTTDAAMFGVDRVHGTLQRYTIAFFTAPQRMTVGAPRHALVVTDPACVVEVLMAYV